MQQFYKDKSIFITGASGFMGKVLLEKLLYSCSDVKQIMILVRPKRGKSAAQRVQDFSTLPVSFFLLEITVDKWEFIKVKKLFRMQSPIIESILMMIFLSLKFLTF